jgi:integrase
MLTLKTIAAIRPSVTLWDDGKGSVAGFGARRQTGQGVSYVLKYRTADGRQRWQTIGRHGAPWTPDMARAEDRRILGEVTKGNDPAAQKQQARRGEIVSSLCDAYLEAAEAGRILTRRKTTKKVSTLATDKGRVERHIKPLLGNLKVAAVTPADIERFRDMVTEGATAAQIKTGKHGFARVTGGRGTATRTMGLLGAIFSFAVKRGLRADNPIRGIDRHADGHRQRRLTAEEYAALGGVLRAMPGSAWPIAGSAAKFLALTGWRRGEMLALKWPDVDLATRTARLADTKTGSSLRPLSYAACDVLRSLPRLGALVFPASTGESKPMRGFHKVWLRIAAKASLASDVTPHVLRHSFASLASDLGYSEPTIAALIGHKGQSMTSRYVHSADAVLLAAADAVADRIAELMGEAREKGTVVELRGRQAF